LSVNYTLTHTIIIADADQTTIGKHDTNQKH